MYEWLTHHPFVVKWESTIKKSSVKGKKVVILNQK